jgi:hypothetical protein
MQSVLLVIAFVVIANAFTSFPHSPASIKLFAEKKRKIDYDAPLERVSFEVMMSLKKSQV